jgi:zinc protease
VGLNSSKLQQALVDKGLASSVGLNYSTSHYTGGISLFVVPNPNKLKECYEVLQTQVSQWSNPDYYTDEQLNDAKAILLRNHSRETEKPSSLPSQLSYQWCSTSLNYFTDLTDNYQKVSRADIAKYISTYITGKPSIAGLIINPEMSKQSDAKTFFVVAK